MRRILIGAFASFFLFASGRTALSVPVDLGPQGFVNSERDANFTGLNGTPFQGQNLSFDLVFSGNEFVRLFTATGGTALGFDLLVILQTNGSGTINFPTATGYIFDNNGNALIAPQHSGGGSISGGNMLSVEFGIFPFYNEATGGLANLPLPLDFYGAHFDLNFPIDPGVQVTGGTLRLLSNEDGHPFGIGPNTPTDLVPDSGGTLLLFAGSVAALGALKRAYRQQ